MSFFNPQIPPLPDGDLRAMIRALEENQNARMAAFASFLARKAVEPVSAAPAPIVIFTMPPALWYVLGAMVLLDVVLIGLLLR